MNDTCCKKPVLIAAAAVAVYTFAYDFIVHGNLLMDLYNRYSSMWRPMPDMQAMTPWCIGFHLLMALIFTTGYFCWRSKITVGAVGSSECPYRKSMKFGLWVGLLLGLPQLMTYLWLPFDTIDLPAAWAISELVKWTLAGFIVSKLYKPV